VIKVSVLVRDIAQLEGLVAQLTVLDLPLGGLTVIPDENPPLRSPARRPYTKRRTKRSKRRSGNMQVKLASISPNAVPPRVWAARTAIQKEFGDKPFPKGQANAVIQRDLKMKSRPTGMIAMLMDAGGLVPV
jgi:hypothetical protein